MADRYWVGGAAQWDSVVGVKWALTSGGVGGQAVPTLQQLVDNIIELYLKTLYRLKFLA